MTEEDENAAYTQGAIERQEICDRAFATVMKSGFAPDTAALLTVKFNTAIAYELKKGSV